MRNIGIGTYVFLYTVIITIADIVNGFKVFGTSSSVIVPNLQ